MKTFKTEKHNIPEGATHYFEETENEKFAWWNENKALLLCPENANEWVPPTVYDDVSNPTKIPQTNIETPEEKEALDLIDTTPHQYEMSKFNGGKKAELVNGDDIEAYGKLYKYVGLDPFNDNLCICLANQDDDPQCFSVDEVKKPETPQQREERERLEAAYDLYLVGNESFNLTTRKSISEFKVDNFQRDFWLTIVDKTNYRKDS